MAIRCDEDASEELREVIRFTGEETGFAPRLIEKDYFCSVILEDLAEADSPLVFKGGTCLAKVHSGFFRLSEDLDFSISTVPDSTRGVRRRAVAPVKELVDRLPTRVPGFQLQVPLQGHNASTLYHATIGYRSLVSSAIETIRIEIGLREPTLTAAEFGQVHTVLLHWAQGVPFLETFPVRCLTYTEAMAEKLRAALTRREVAIRDFFDIDHAVRHTGLEVTGRDLMRLLRAKLVVPGTGSVNVSPQRLAELRLQLHARLRPVLRLREFESFDVDRAFGIVRAVAAMLG